MSSLFGRLVTAVLELAEEAELATRPIELEPYRGRLFELFVAADAAGYTREDSSPSLTAEELCRELGERWGLKLAAQELMSQNGRMTTEHLAKMRLLWSIMRLWMEWSYAWHRWSEFHDSVAQQHPHE